MRKQTITKENYGALERWRQVFILFAVIAAGGLTMTARAQNNCAPKVVPGRIEAECYDAAANVQTEATTDDGGGLDVGYITEQSYLQYNVSVAQSGNYSLYLRVASPNGTPRALRFEIIGNGRNPRTVFDIPATGGYQNWTTIVKNVRLNAGLQTLRITAQSVGWNINWLEFGAAQAYLDTRL